MSQPPKRKDFAALLLLSLSVVLWEILLTRIYSVMLFYHFAFMAVSVAMFGLTCGAVMVMFRKAKPRENEHDSLGELALSSAILMALTMIIQISIPPPFKGPWASTAMLARTYLLSTLPFIPAGAFISIYLTRYSNVGKLYAADLLGAGLACAGVPVILSLWGGPGAALVAAGIACVAAALCFDKSRARTIAFLIGAGLIGFATINNDSKLLRIRWRNTSLLPPPLFERWNAFSRIMVHESGSEPFGWGIDSELRAKFPPVEQLTLEIDSGAGTPLTRFTGALEPVQHLKYDVTSFAHYLRPNADVLVIGAGGGRDILSAIVFGQKSVRGVEVNPSIVHAVHETFGDFTGHLARRPDVQIITDEGRSYLQKTTDHFDIVQASLVDTVAATAAGAYAFVENGLYTQEAWQLFMDRLTPRGMVSFSRWYYGSTTWPVEVLRLIALGTKTLKNRGVENPAAHIMLIRNRNLTPGHEGIATLLVAKSPFTKEDIAAARKASRLIRAELALAGGEGDPLLAALVNTKDPERVYRELPLDISPPTDDKPYFFFHARLKDVFASRDQQAFGGSSFNLPAVRMLLNLLGMSLVLAVGLVVVPGRALLKKQKNLLKNRTATFGLALYFAIIGLAFMLIEVAWIQRFSIYLGHPTYGFTVILFGMLAATAIGSWATTWLKPTQTRRAMGILVLALFALDPYMANILRDTAGADFPSRLAVTLAFIGLPAFVMGFFFPLGMSLTQRLAPQGASWYWAINGALSVLGSVIAMLCCLSLGIHATIVIGAAFYLAATLLYMHLTRLTSSRAITAGI